MKLSVLAQLPSISVQLKTNEKLFDEIQFCFTVLLYSQYIEWSHEPKLILPTYGIWLIIISI